MRIYPTKQLADVRAPERDCLVYFIGTWETGEIRVIGNDFDLSGINIVVGDGAVLRPTPTSKLQVGILVGRAVPYAVRCGSPHRRDL